MELEENFEQIYNESHNIMSGQESLRENMKLEETAVFRKSESGLPANLYLDDSGTWKNSRHWKRIKFQPDKGDHPDTRTMIPMSIDDNPQVLVNNSCYALQVEIEQKYTFKQSF